MDDFQEYVTFYMTDSNGEEVEMAVLEEFSFEKKDYIAAAVIENDTINEDGVFIYRVKALEDDFSVEKITNHVEYEKVANAYLDMQQF